MVESETVTPSSNGARPLPDVVRIVGSPRFSANQLRLLKAATGLELQAVMGDAAAVVQAFAWLELRKAGHDVSWEAAGDMPVEFVEAPPDPTYADTVTASPPSVGSGA